jgi:hypothetical protein
MKSIVKVGLATALAVTVGAARLSAQGPEVKPGPEHAILKESEGTWEAIINAGGAESKGTSNNKVALNGLWLIEEFAGDMGGMKFEGRGSMSYDPAKKKYIHIWIDSMSTSPMISEGTYDKSTKSLTLTGNMSMPDGSSMKVTQTTTTKDANTRVFSLKGAGPDGKDMEMIQITYKRQAKKSAVK